MMGGKAEGADRSSHLEKSWMSGGTLWVPSDFADPNERLYEYWDDYLMNPRLYKIGIERTCFSKKLFIQWIAYALWHSGVIFFTTLFVLNNYQTHQTDGKDIGFWVAGLLNFGICIFVANLEIAMRFH